MKIPNGQGNMMPQPMKPPGGPQMSQPPGGIQAQAVDQSGLDRVGQFFQSQGQATNRARDEVSRYQDLVDSMMRRIGQAQAQGARPSDLAMMQSQLDVLMRQLNDAKMGEQRQGQQRLLEQQLQRTRQQSTTGPVGGRGTQDAQQRSIGNLEDQILATMLGIGGLRTMR